MDQEFKYLCEKLKPLFNELRGICSHANDRLIEKLSELTDLNVIRINSGERLEDWTVPKAWDLIDSYTKVGDKIYTKENCKLMVPFGSDSWEYQGDLLSIKSQIVSDYSKLGMTPYRTSYYNDDKPVICLLFIIAKASTASVFFSIEIGFLLIISLTVAFFIFSYLLLALLISPSVIIPTVLPFLF